MGRDQTRMLICAVASLALIIAGAVMLDWYRLTLDGSGAIDRLAVDLHTIRACTGRICGNRPLALLPGMSPTLATVALWASLCFSALVTFQAGARLLTGSAPDAVTRLGYMLALMAISLAVATAYLFGPEPHGVSVAIGTRLDFPLRRTWAPLTLIAGLSLGFGAIYPAIARESSDLAAAYKPVTVDPVLVAEHRARQASMPIPTARREHTGTMRAAHTTGPPYPRAQPAVMRHPTGPPYAREQSAVMRAAVSPADASYPREQSGVMRAHLPPAYPSYPREQSGVMRSAASPVDAPEQSGIMRANLPPAYPSAPREQSGVMRANL